MKGNNTNLLSKVLQWKQSSYHVFPNYLRCDVISDVNITGELYQFQIIRKI